MKNNIDDKYRDIISSLSGAKRITPDKGIREAYQCKCPCHDDREASLTVSLTDDAEKILLHCHAGCDNKDILAALGLTYTDICGNETELNCFSRLVWFYSSKAEWTDDKGAKHTGYGDGVKLVAEYPYYDEAGAYKYSKLRFEGGQIKGKLIRYYRIDRVNDEATACKSGHDKYLYNLPDFLRYRKSAEWVYIAEGEKDIETLRKVGNGFGCCITAGGVSDWKPEHAKYFKGLNVVILADNDKAGKQAAEKIKKDLRAYAYCIKVVVPSGEDHGDVTDYLTKEGGTSQSLKELIEAASCTYNCSVNIDDKGNPKGINAGILADQIAKNERHIIVRNQADDKDIFLRYEGGSYKEMNKPSIKALIKEYIPSAKVSDNLLNNVCNLLFATSDNVRKHEDINSDSTYINFRNGLYNRKTKQMEKHRPEILSTIQYDFDYVPDQELKHTNFDKYITDACTKADGSVDEDEIRIIQEYMGFIISNIPMSKLKKAMILWSRLGNSGKSVLIRLLCRILSIDRVATIKLKELTPDNRFILGTLPNCRLIACGDESNSNINDSSIFKSLTGGDPVKIEPKGKQGYSFEYKGGFAIACNGLPCFVDDKGNHLFDRLMILPFEHHITDDMKDAALDEKLAAEIPAIVSWAIEGLHRLIDNGYTFTKSKSSEMSKETYHKTMDNVYRFVTENYIITHKYDDRISKKDFDDAYHVWACQDETVKEVERKNLSVRMDALGITTSTGNTDIKRNVFVYRGIRQKEAADEDFTYCGNLADEIFK